MANASPVPPETLQPGPESLEAVIVTQELARRPSKPKNFETDSRALIELAKHLANSPATILQKLVEIAVEALDAGSAGVSLLHKDTGDFYWPAIAGAWRPNIGGGTPRSFGPCGTVLDRDAVVLFAHPERHFAYLAAASPAIEEALLAPFYVNGKAVGTVWLISHDPNRRFDLEDQRVLNSLGEFAAAAFQALEGIQTSKSSASSLEEKEAFLRCIVTSSADCIKVLDLSGKIEWMSDGSLVAMEISVFSDVAGANWPGFWKGDLTAEAMRSLAAARVGGVGRFKGYCPTYKGTPRWWDVVVTPILGPGGEVIRLLATSRDITHQHVAEEALTAARDTAIQASGAKDRFLAGLSHELRTPLNPILLVASEAAKNPALPAQVRADFEMVRKNVELETRLIEDLLDLTRATHGKMSLKISQLDVAEVLGDALRIIEEEIEAKGVTVRQGIPDDLPKLEGDPVRLQQVFWNLLRNAVKFTPAGGLVTLVACVSENRERLRVEVTDTGIGLSTAEIERLFVPFSQGEHADGPTGSVQFGGLGLGLSISSQVVELHKGTLAATSAGQGKGSTFAVELPLRSRKPSESSGASPGSGENLQKIKKLRILLVEDHEPTRDTLKRLLAMRGHHIEAIASGFEFSQRKNRPVDLVICDIGLPDASGNDLFKEMRRLYPETVGFALSGYGAEDDIERAKDSGFTEHLVKPVTMGQVDLALAKHFAS
jgi:PAS domain S-box-containing protein